MLSSSSSNVTNSNKYINHFKFLHNLFVYKYKLYQDNTDVYLK